MINRKHGYLICRSFAFLSICSAVNMLLGGGAIADDKWYRRGWIDEVGDVYFYKGSRTWDEDNEEWVDPSGAWVGYDENKALLALKESYNLLQDILNVTPDKENTDNFRFWNRPFIDNKKYISINNLDISTNSATSHGVSLGIDCKHIKIDALNAFFVPSVFFNISKFGIKKTDSDNEDCYYFGVKGDLYNDSNIVKVIVAYSPHHSTKKLKIFSVGFKYSYNFNISKTLILQPEVFATYNNTKLPKDNIGEEDVIYANFKRTHRFYVSPGVSITKKFETFDVKVSARYCQQYGSAPRFTLDNQTFKYAELFKKKHAEIGIGFTTNLTDKAKIGVELSKIMLGQRGVKLLSKFDFIV
ncbi:MAG: hypothetical protein IJ481_01080 [Alphaproteobacteria bacterium]|nr:hypothetical protein [Alphaproteobacteria bacterium]